MKLHRNLILKIKKVIENLHLLRKAFVCYFFNCFYYADRITKIYIFRIQKKDYSYFLPFFAVDFLAVDFLAVSFLAVDFLAVFFDICITNSQLYLLLINIFEYS